MALLKKIIKADPREVIVKWTGSGTDTLTLASLVQNGQALTGVLAPAVNILAVSTSQANGGAVTITRNSEVTLHAHDNYEFQADGIISAVMNENSTSDIVVDLANTGTLILRIKKMQGYAGI
jgi:hypothetical protein